MPETKNLFNSVAKNYDTLNSLFSVGIDKFWRRRLVQELENAGLVLDIATGTAEVAIEALNKWEHIHVMGLDPSEEMLSIAQKKLKALGLYGKTALLQGIAERLAFKDESFDAITIAFGIRNTADTMKSLKEMHRVLKTGGCLAVLEFALPRNKVFGPAYMFYLRNFMPFVGSLFGREKEYKYLGDSISQFPQRESFVRLIEEAGFQPKTTTELTMGTVILYVGIKKT